MSINTKRAKKTKRRKTVKRKNVRGKTVRGKTVRGKTFKRKTVRNKKGGMYRSNPYQQYPENQYPENQENQYQECKPQYQEYPQYPENQYQEYPENQYQENQYQECNVNAVAMDCEMVRMKLDNKLGLAHIAIVNFDGEEIYNKYVIPTGGIKGIDNYLTKFSGITPNILKNIQYDTTHFFDNVREEVMSILDGKTIVGHGLDSDFKALNINSDNYYVWDTAKIPEYQKINPRNGTLQARKLKNLAEEIGNNIQQNTGKGHSPLEDARASMNLYRNACRVEKLYYNNMSK